MSTHETSIEWTEHSWNPITGCKELSPGCANCYAARLAATRLERIPRYTGLAVVSPQGHPHWTGEVYLHEDKLREPFGRKKGKKIFVCDMSDLFYEGVPTGFIHKIWAVMARCQQHTFQVLTKRIQRAKEYLGYFSHGDRAEWRDACHELGLRWPDPLPDPLPNVWLGTSIENQATWNERAPVLGHMPAAVRFVSFEPLLESILLFDSAPPRPGARPLFDSGIIGGESGPGARDCDV